MPNKIKNLGNNLTVLSDQEATVIYKKYFPIVRRVCSRIKFLQGIEEKDIIQECFVNIFSGWHTYKKNKAKRSSWVYKIAKNCVNNIQKQHLAKTRTNFLYDPDAEKEVPVYDYSFNALMDFEGEEFLMEEIYTGCSDNRPIYGTKITQPDEALKIKDMCKELRENLSDETFKFILEELFKNSPDIFAIIEDSDILSIKPNNQEPPPKEFETIFNEKNLDKIGEIAQLMIKKLKYKPKEILEREKTLGLFFNNYNYGI